MLSKMVISPINETKEKTDEDFNNALKICVNNLDLLVFVVQPQR